jgi:CBS domain containing-hemolysin-like protein
VTDIWILVPIFLLVLVLDFITIAARAAFLQSSHARLLGLRDEPEERIMAAATLLLSLPRVRASLNLFLVWLRSLLVVLVGWTLVRHPLVFAPWSTLGVILVVMLLVFWLEWGIERNISRTPEAAAAQFYRYVRVLMTLARPLLAMLSIKDESQRPLETPGNVTEAELKTLVDAGQQEGVFEVGERRMIFSVFELRDTLAREIMVPRIDVVALDIASRLDAAADLLLRSGHSRIPVYENTIDHMVGVLYAKDLLRAWREGAGRSLRDLLRPPYFVPEAKKVDDLLAEMRSQSIHIAIVVDEYGGVAGLVTLEDIVEEIMGEIRDEYDQAEELPYQELKTGEFVFLGRIDLDDFNDIMKSELPKDEADTLGGFIYSQLGRVPAVGETVREGDLLLTVEQVSARRIDKVRAEKLALTPEDGEKRDDANG